MKLLERYEEMRLHCLRYGNLHHDSKEVCHQAIAECNNTLAYHLALLLDDMAIALGITGDGRGEAVARVAEVHMSRYTIEWTRGPLPEGTELYATPPQQEQAVPGTIVFNNPSYEPWLRQQAAPGAVQDDFVMVPREADERIKRAIFVMLASADDEGLFYRKLIQVAAAPKVG